MSKKLDELKKKQETLLKEIAKIEQLEKQKEEEANRERQKLEVEKALAEKLKLEKIREKIRKKRISVFHMDVDTKLMRNIFYAISTIQSEAVFSLKKKQIECIGVDPAHVAMYTIKIPSSSLEDYDCKTDHDIGVDIDKITDVLSRRKNKGKKSGDEIAIDEYKEDTMLYLSWETGHGHYNRSVKLIETAGLPVPKMPSLTLPAEFTVNTDSIIEFVKEANSVSDHFSVTTSDAGVRFEAAGDEDRIELILSGKKYKPYRSLFSIDYFENAIKSMKPFFKQLTLRIGTDNPIEISGKAKIEMKILLAPRIESE